MAQDCSRCKYNRNGYCERIRKDVRDYDTSREHEREGCDE